MVENNKDDVKQSSMMLIGLLVLAIFALAFYLKRDGGSDFYSKGREAPGIGAESDFLKMAAMMRSKEPSYEGSSAAGSYLSGRFAQRHHDWDTAGKYIDYVLKSDSQDVALLKRAMVLAMGAGRYDEAMKFAHTVLDIDESAKDEALTLLFLSAEAFKAQDYKQASALVAEMPDDGMSSFITPLLKGWSDAAMDIYDTENLKDNSIHLYHAILIAEYMKKTDAVEAMLKQAIGSGEMGNEDVERIADIYAHLGEKDRAVTLYEQALMFDGDNVRILAKLEAAQAGDQSDLFVRVRTPEQGVAEALYDMGRLLMQEFSDESARVFTRTALYLNPDHTRAKFLLAQIATRNERFDDAIALYQSIDKDDDEFIRSQRMAADILYEQGRVEDAVKALKVLANDYDDLDALIQIGDIYRLEERFKDAIKTYNEAEKRLGSIGREHWHLLYVRGMSYEQNGQWDKAEKDLTLALSYEPDHPYVLNYLGYAWADQGKNLKKSLQMISRAVLLRPNDGYITDSLGWVYFQMGQFREAVPYLEKAVELMPYDPIINDHLGDAYWKVGRNLEAEFQWTRARNHTDDEALIKIIDEKLLNGLGAMEGVAANDNDIAEDSHAVGDSENKIIR